MVVTRRLKIDTTPVSQTTKTTHVVRHTSTPAQVVTKTITIEGDGEPLTAEELAEIMNMSGSETKVSNCYQVLIGQPFVQLRQKFVLHQIPGVFWGMVGVYLKFSKRIILKSCWYFHTKMLCFSTQI